MQSMRSCAAVFFVAPAFILFTGVAPFPSRGYSDTANARLEALPPLEAWRKARVNGKYQMLLRQIAVPDDGKRYADFHDDGPRQLKQYAGHTDLPAGHWVYVYPNWYIWRDLTAAPKVKRGWGPEQ